MGEKPAWSFHLPAEHQHTPMQPCTAKTGDAEGNQQFLSLRLKVKLNQACSGSRGTSERPKAETHRGSQRHSVCHHFTSSGSALTCQQTKAFCAWLFPRASFCLTFADLRQVGQLGQPISQHRGSKCPRHARHPPLIRAHGDSQHPFQMPKLFNKLLVDLRLEISQGCLDWELIQWQTSGFEKGC